MIEHPRRFVFWQNSISIHQAPLLRALAENPGVSVVVVAFSGLSDHRRSLGWDFPDYGDAKLIQCDDQSEVAMVVADLIDSDVHVFSGVSAYPSVSRAFSAVSKRTHGVCMVATEPWDDRGVRGLLRMARANVRLLGHRKHISAILSCGSRVRSQLRRSWVPLGFPVYDFGYFVEAFAVSRREHYNGPRQVVFVGEISERKAPADLLQSLASIHAIPWRLAVVGVGAQRAKLEDIARARGVEDRITFTGSLDQVSTRRIIAESEVLVLPSRHDGWGAVVNEALAEGTRVIVSDAAGASDLIVDSRLGSVYPAGRTDHLTAALESVLRDVSTETSREWIRDWARRSIAPGVIATYLLNIAQAVPNPVDPPWKQGRQG